MDEKDQKSQQEDKESSDKALWEHVTRDVTPLDKQKLYQNQSEDKKTTQKTLQTRQIDTKKQALPQSNEIDRQTARRLKRGQIAVEARLDLHGMNQNQAHDALNRLIPLCYGQRKRCVLVITGKGTQRSSSAECKPGILKQKVPEWLNEPPLKKFILKIQTAHIKDGGEGAVYVYLRRQRS